MTICYKNPRYRESLKRYQEQFVRTKELQVDNLVLRRVLTREGANKLSPGWEGPFRVTQVCCPGCVCLATKDGEPEGPEKVTRGGVNESQLKFSGRT
jgi:hypothetical protein